MDVLTLRNHQLCLRASPTLRENLRDPTVSVELIAEIAPPVRETPVIFAEIFAEGSFLREKRDFLRKSKPSAKISAIAPLAEFLACGLVGLPSA